MKTVENKFLFQLLELGNTIKIVLAKYQHHINSFGTFPVNYAMTFVSKRIKTRRNL